MRQLHTMISNTSIEPQTGESTQIGQLSMDATLQRGILDAVLNQPANIPPAELMRNAYHDYKDLSASGTDLFAQMHAMAPSKPISPFQLKSILMEHCYARPFNWRPESHFLRPAKSIYMPQQEDKDEKGLIKNEIVDVCGIDDVKVVHYDVESARKLMDECEQHVAGVRDTVEFENWEVKVPKINWSMIQHNMFNSIVDILNSDRLSRLAYAKNATEPALRRSVIEKSVKRFRRLMGKYMWDVKLIQWLHSVLMEHLNAWHLGAYLDILQTTSHKLPSFVEKLMGDSNNHNRQTCLNSENLQKLLKRVWNPVAPDQSSDRIKRILGEPVLIVVPSTTSFATNTPSKRLTRWINYFSKMATLVTVTAGNRCTKKMTLAHCAEQALLATRAKVQDVQHEYQGRPIILIGVHSGSSIALQAAHVEPVVGVVCFGFSIYTPAGKRGEPDDNILDLFAPVLFVIGQCANTVLQENLEDIRERMNVETGLLVVAGADDYLRVNKRIKRAEGITQGIVDRRIAEEVFDFVSGLMLSPFPPQVRQHQSVNENAPEFGAKRPKVERKRNNSNGSSLDSEPPSPTPRVARQGPGRPLGSKSIRKLDSKFYAKYEGSNVPSSPSSNSLTPPNPPSTPESFGEADIPIVKVPGIYSHSIQPGGMLPHLKHPGGLKVIPSNPNKQIKVLDNIMVSTGIPGKMLPGVPPRPGGNYSPNMVLMPDGRYKAAPPPPVIRGSTASQLTKLLTNRHLGASTAAGIPATPAGSAMMAQPGLTKYITFKKQLAGNPPKLVKKSYTPAMPANLPPPANLTSQDILNLPIIFADDNQMIQPSQVAPKPPPQVMTPQLRMTGGQPEIVLVNKQGQTVVRKQILHKRPLSKKLPPGAASAVRYSLQTMKMDVDYEGELDANTIPKRIMPSTSKAFDASYKTEIMSSDIVNSKIKQVIRQAATVHDPELQLNLHQDANDS